MNLRREGFAWIIGAALPAIATYGYWVYTENYWSLALFVIFAALSVFFVYFFRDPDRTPDFANTTDSAEPRRNWLAPADGIVKSIDEEEDGRTRLVIFLTVFNVHVNRMPVSGKVHGIEYREGRFLPAFAEDLEQRNERNRILCRDSFSRPFEVWQIAGMLARRIHFWYGLNDSFEQGDRFGMISLSSRTDLILPGDVQPTVSPKETVRGGRTVVARG